MFALSNKELLQNSSLEIYISPTCHLFQINSFIDLVMWNHVQCSFISKLQLNSQTFNLNTLHRVWCVNSVFLLKLQALLSCCTFYCPSNILGALSSAIYLLYISSACRGLFVVWGMLLFDLSCMPCYTLLSDSVSIVQFKTFVVCA